MSRQSRPSSRKSNKSTPQGCQQSMKDLQRLMKSIKDIQQRVSHLPIHLQLSRSTRPTLVTPMTKNLPKPIRHSKSRNSSKTIQTRCQTSHSKPNRYLQQLNIQTQRKSKASQRYHSAILNNQSKTFEISITGQNSSQGRGGDCGQRRRKNSHRVGGPQSYFESLKKPEIMRQYVSLQLENLKLQKLNLQLEKQLIEKSLMMERREKQLLKSKLKRMKTYKTNQRSQPRKIQTANIQIPPITSFDLSPVAIKKSCHENQLILRQKVTESLKVKQNQSQNKCILEDADSLLISDDTDYIPQENSQKYKDTTLQTEFWEMMGFFRRQKKEKGVRSALGDIANNMQMPFK